MPLFWTDKQGEGKIQTWPSAAVWPIIFVDRKSMVVCEMSCCVGCYWLGVCGVAGKQWSNGKVLVGNFWQSEGKLVGVDKVLLQKNAQAGWGLRISENVVVCSWFLLDRSAQMLTAGVFFSLISAASSSFALAKWLLSCCSKGQKIHLRSAAVLVWRYLSFCCKSLFLFESARLSLICLGQESCDLLAVTATTIFKEDRKCIPKKNCCWQPEGKVCAGFLFGCGRLLLAIVLDSKMWMKNPVVDSTGYGSWIGFFVVNMSFLPLSK